MIPFKDGELRQSHYVLFTVPSLNIIEYMILLHSSLQTPSDKRKEWVTLFNGEHRQATGPTGHTKPRVVTASLLNESVAFT